MTKFLLIEPSLERKDDIIEYLDEFVKYNSPINGSGGLDKIYEGYTFEDALYRCQMMRDEEYTKDKKCKSKTFMLVREDNNRIVGMINVRWDLSEELKKFGGNIGYSIRPTERRKGYNKINLFLGLLEAQKLGLKTVMLDCDAENIASYKTMDSLGGILDREEIDPYDGLLTKIYTFDVDKCIDTHKLEFESLIK